MDNGSENSNSGNSNSGSLKVLGLELEFKTGADMERAQTAARLLEDMYIEQKARGLGSQSKDIILTFLALALADELIQMKTREEQRNTRLYELLAKIEKSL